MKKLHLLPWLALAFLVMAFVPSMTNFNPNQFPTTGTQVSIKSGALLTNPVVNTSILLTNNNNAEFEILSLASGFSFFNVNSPAVPLALIRWDAAIFGSNVVSSWGAFTASHGGYTGNGFTNTAATASTVAAWDSAQGIGSIPNGSGALTNNGAGLLGWSAVSGGTTQGGVATNSILQATNIIGIQDSIVIPAGAFFSFNMTAPATNALFISVTNLCEGYWFGDAITNEIRTRFALPYDWDGGTVKMQISALCTGTNTTAVNATNVVWAVAAAALTAQADISSPSFGTAIWVTNAINKAAFIEGNAVTGPITVGGSPSAAKSILWQIQRLGAQAGDTLTNLNALVLTEARVFFTRNLTTTNVPTSSP